MREGGGAEHDADHEAGEDQAEWGRRGGRTFREHGCPQEDEDVHARLHDALDAAEEEDLAVGPNKSESLLVSREKLDVLVAVVLLPGKRDDGEAECKAGQGQEERGHGTEAQVLSEEVGQ